MATTATDDATFAGDVLHRPGWVLVEFWAPWCGPCRVLRPVLEEIATLLAADLRVVTLDTDENPEVTAACSVTSIPTLQLYRNGQVTAEIVGARPKHELITTIHQHLHPVTSPDAALGGKTTS